MSQILFIHGGDSFYSYEAYLENLRSSELKYERLLTGKRWTDTLVTSFPDWDILMPSMPCKQNAKFEEWAIWFEKIIPFLSSETRIIGHSLGAMFLAKYLHQKPLPFKVAQLHLLAGAYGGDEDHGSFEVESACGLEASAEHIFLYHSEDDFVVRYENLAKFAADLPNAKICSFTDKNHFLDPEFPEIIQNIAN